MENTAINEFLRGYRLKSWLFLKTWNKLSVHGKTDIELAMKYYTEELQAKHEEELKQAVVKAYEEGRWVNSHISIPQRTAEQYYEANFKTKEL